jgi:transcriptional regulator with XRE-family HTH domain
MASMETFRERLHTLRLQAGLTQEQLGRRAGITGRQISTYEHGYAKPRALTGQQIASALGVSLAYLLGEEESVIFEQDGIPVFSSNNAVNDVLTIDRSATNFFLPIKPINNRKFISFSSFGDSLLPEYSENDYLLIDLEQEFTEKNISLFLINYCGRWSIKRIQKNIAKGGFILTSPNHLYPPFTVEESELKDLIIVGRVVGSIHY